MSRALLLAALVLGAAALAYQGWDMFARTPPRLALQGSDDSFYYFWVRSAVVDRDLNFANDLHDAPTMDESARLRAQAEPLTALGLERNKYPPGWAIAVLPFFLLAHALALVTGGPADGWQPIYFTMIALGHLGYGLAGLWLARRVLLHYLPADAATIGVLAGWLCSPLVYYQTARFGMPHGLCFTLLALVYERTLAALTQPERRQPWLVTGAAAGLLLITRPTCALYLLFPAAVAVRLLAQAATRPVAVRRLPWAVIPALVAAAIYLAAQYQLHGTWRIDTYDSEPFHFDRPQLWATLFSPHHGWLYWHPFLLLGLVPLLVAVARRQLPATWFASLVLVIYVNAAWWCWWWGSSFGSRAYEGATLFAMTGLGWLWHKTGPGTRPRQLLMTGIALGTLANAILLALFMTGAISRTEPVTHAQMGAALLKLFSP